MAINTIAFTLGSDEGDSTRLLDLSASQACASSLICWNSANTSPEHPDATSSNQTVPSGAALCCTDGTVFLFRSRQRPERIEITAPPTTDSTEHSRSPSPLRYPGLGIGRGRSSSPASPSFGFFQPSKSRIVSGVSTEQVEAPKTSVDYDEEPEKLKDLLKGKSRKDRPSIDSRPPNDNSTTMDSIPSTPKSNRSQKRRSGSRTLLSTTLTSTSSSISLDSPPSPARLSISQSLDGLTDGALELACHIFPSSPGTGQAVTGIQVISGGHFLLYVRKSG